MTCGHWTPTSGPWILPWRKSREKVYKPVPHEGTLRAPAFTRLGLLDLAQASRFHREHEASHLVLVGDERIGLDPDDGLLHILIQVLITLQAKVSRSRSPSGGR